MRSKITIFKTTHAPIDYNYQYEIASMLYKKLAESDVELANETHSHKGFKFYTFSNLILEDKKRCETGLSFNRAHFFLSSPDDRFIKSFAEGLLMSPEFYLEGLHRRADFTIERIEILTPSQFKNKCTFKTISPIYIKTQRYHNGTIRETDLYPNEPKFYENLHKNLVERYTKFYNTPPEKDYYRHNKNLQHQTKTNQNRRKLPTMQPHEPANPGSPPTT